MEKMLFERNFTVHQAPIASSIELDNEAEKRREYNAFAVANGFHTLEELESEANDIKLNFPKIAIEEQS